jgi:hypothetical protein
VKFSLPTTPKFRCHPLLSSTRQRPSQDLALVLFLLPNVCFSMLHGHHARSSGDIENVHGRSCFHTASAEALQPDSCWTLVFDECVFGQTYTGEWW